MAKIILIMASIAAFTASYDAGKTDYCNQPEFE